MASWYAVASRLLAPMPSEDDELALGMLDGPARQGEQRLNPEEFERHFGWLPTDDEG